MAISDTDIINLRERVARARELGDNAVLAQQLVRYGLALAINGDPTEARAVAKEGLLLQRQIGNVHGQAEAMTTLGRIYQSVELLEQAEQIFVRVLELYRGVDDRRNLVLTLARLAQLRRDMGKLTSARGTYVEALEAARRVGDRALTARVQSSAAALYREVGEGGRAHRLLEEAQAAQTDDPAAQAETMARLAAILQDEGDLSTALSLLQSAHALQQEAGKPVAAARTLARLAHLQFLRGAFEVAWAQFEEAENEQMRLKDRRGLTRTRVGLAAVYVAEGDHGAAIAVLEDELAGLRDRGLRFHECAVSIHLAATHLHAGDASIGNIYLDRAHDLAMKMGCHLLMAACRGVASSPDFVFEPSGDENSTTTSPRDAR